jgi:hypothetical protein
MKPTVKNLRARAILTDEIKRRPDFEPESTTSGKIHGGYGILCDFTDRDACEETLRALGFVPKRTFGSFTEWKREGGAL